MADYEKDLAAETDGKTTYQMEEDIEREEGLRRIRTANTLSISPELFEKIYLSPKNQVSNNLRTTFGNPTPVYDDDKGQDRGHSDFCLAAEIANSLQCRRRFHLVSDPTIERSPWLARIGRPWGCRSVCFRIPPHTSIFQTHYWSFHDPKERSCFLTVKTPLSEWDRHRLPYAQQCSPFCLTLSTASSRIRPRLTHDFSSDKEAHTTFSAACL